VESDEHPGVVEDLFLSIDATMDHHFIVAKGVGNMSFARWRLVAKSLEWSPRLLFDVELVDVAE
jgi:hypothetical protein